MWKKEFLVNSWVDVLFVNKHKAIVIWPKGSIKRDFCISHIFPKNNREAITIEEKDYDILKLKSLLIAKDIGWKVSF